MKINQKQHITKKGVVKRNPPRKPKFDYRPEDFRIIKYPKTNDIRIPFAFASKDNKVTANFFWHDSIPVGVRGLIYDDKTGLIIGDFHFEYLFGKERSESEKPKPEGVLSSIIMRINRGEISFDGY